AEDVQEHSLPPVDGVPADLRGRDPWALRQELKQVYASDEWRRSHGKFHGPADHEAALERGRVLELALAHARPGTTPTPSPSAVPPTVEHKLWGDDVAAARADQQRLEAVAAPLGMSDSIPFLLSAMARHASATPPPERGSEEEHAQAEQEFQTLVD